MGTEVLTLSTLKACFKLLSGLITRIKSPHESGTKVMIASLLTLRWCDFGEPELRCFTRHVPSASSSTSTRLLASASSLCRCRTSCKPFCTRRSRSWLLLHSRSSWCRNSEDGGGWFVALRTFEGGLDGIFFMDWLLWTWRRDHTASFPLGPSGNLQEIPRGFSYEIPRNTKRLCNQGSAW